VKDIAQSTLGVDCLCQELLDALDSFDRQTLPLGLYASEEYGAAEKPFPRLYQEWVRCLAPCLKQLGYKTSLPSKPTAPHVLDGEFDFDLPDRRQGRIDIARVSKVKVRRFGSAYRIDAHEKFGERWDDLRLDRRIPDLWKPSSVAQGDHIGLRMFLFIGFAREADPFGKELDTLESQLEWHELGVEYHTRTWADREGRAFNIRLSLWVNAIPGEKRPKSGNVS
jgi:hypothetical protein